MTFQERDGQGFVWAHLQQEPLGSLQSYDVTILRSLRSCEGVELECYANACTEPARTLSRCAPRRSQPFQTRKIRWKLSVTVYGPIKWLDSVGDYLSRNNQYLQTPLQAQRNLPYLNPQSLSLELKDAPLTFDLKRQATYKELLDEISAKDPSSQLDTVNEHPELRAPSSVKTELFQ